MYKKIRRIMFFSIAAGLLFISFIIILYSMLSWKEYSQGYRVEQMNKVNYFFEDQFKDLESIHDSHAVWTDAIKGLKNKDEEWLYENATGYMIDNSSYSVDFILISDENKEFSKFYSDSLEPFDFENLDIYKKALNENISQERAIWIDGKLTLIIASPFFNNNREEPYGVYLLGKVIDTEEKDQLKMLLSNRDVDSIEFTKEEVLLDSLGLVHRDINLNVPLLNSTDTFVNINFDLDYLGFLFYYQPLMIILLITLILVGLFWFINNNIRYMTRKLREIIRFIKRISDGEYHLEIEREKGNLYPELDSLVNSTNRMAEDIRYHIKSVEERNILLDEKYNEMINLLNNVVEMNDQYTFHHSSKVSEYAIALGKHIGFTDLDNLSLASKLHDIGKVAIPTEILNKPSRLTNDEYDIIKTHSKRGYDLLSHSKIFHEARMGVLYHHERYNGEGYPMGLQGNDIPMIAQIITVADAFEAMTSDRSYRKAMSEDMALKILIEEKGEMFNPDLVEAFVQIINENIIQEQSS